MDITQWLAMFQQAWASRNVEAVILLFSDEVEYWETPFQQLASLEDVKNEWQVIREQKDINISTRLFASDNNMHSVTWQLTYTDQSGEQQNWAGTYLIVLNERGECTYFHQTGETA